MNTNYLIIFTILMVLVPLTHGLEVNKNLEYFYTYLRQYICTATRFWFQLF